MHYAAKIIRIVLGDDDLPRGYAKPAEKRNSGLIDTVLNMPSLESYGRRK